MAKIVAWNKDIRRLLRDYDVNNIVPDKFYVTYNVRKNAVEIMYFTNLRNEIIIYLHITPEELIEKYNIYIEVEQEEEIEPIIPTYLRRVVNNDELIDFVTYFIKTSATWRPDHVLKYIKFIFNPYFRTVRFITTDPCTGNISSSFFDTITFTIELWKWRYEKIDRVRYYGEHKELELYYVPDYDKLLFIYEEGSGDFRDSSTITYAAMWPKGGLKIKRTKEYVYCGPDGYAETKEEIIEL